MARRSATPLFLLFVVAFLIYYGYINGQPPAPVEIAPSPASLLVPTKQPEVEVQSESKADAIPHEVAQTQQSSSFSKAESSVDGTSYESTQGSTSPVSDHYLFVFGDSYSSHSHAGFTPQAPLVPTAQNPMGYLEPTKDEGTFSGGDIWVDVFVNKSRPGTLVYNYATPGNVVNYTRLGATFDPLLMAITNPVKDMVMQIGHFETIHSKKVSWKASNSLFVNWFGVNDLTATQLHSKLPGPEMEKLIEAQVGDYWELVRRQYKLGARNFLHILVPPMHRIPSYADFNPTMMPMAKHLAQIWSTIMRENNKVFESQHVDVKTAVFETADVFNHMMDNYKDYGARNDNCFSYGQDTLCLWYDFLHPGEAIQREMGKGIWALSKKHIGAW